jgi:hypothetical protein
MHQPVPILGLQYHRTKTSSQTTVTTTVIHPNHQLTMRGFGPLMTVSTTVIIVCNALQMLYIFTHESRKRLKNVKPRHAVLARQFHTSLGVIALGCYDAFCWFSHAHWPSGPCWRTSGTLSCVLISEVLHAPIPFQRRPLDHPTV